MLITRILGDCPSCKGKNSFGNVSIHQDHVQQGCKLCSYEPVSFLPKIQKKVLYLDQAFFSLAFKGRDSRFLTAIEKVKHMAHLQLIVAPYSSVHEDETHLWHGHKELMEFIKETARGAKFKKAHNVKRTQILKAWESFLKGQPTEYVFEKSDAIEDSLDAWDDYIRIDVNSDMRDIQCKRTRKTRAVQELIDAFSKWQTSKQTFEQDVALEIRDAGKAMVNQISSANFNIFIDSPIVDMLYWLPEDQPLVDRMQRCMEFLASEHFANIPNLWIEARMFATLKGMVKQGAYANRNKAHERLSGVFEDFEQIALYAPYCDAFFMDRSMAELVRKPTVGLKQRYGIEVFSVTNWDHLIAWLNGLQTSMNNEHKAGVEDAYP